MVLKSDHLAVWHANPRLGAKAPGKVQKIYLKGARVARLSPQDLETQNIEVYETDIGAFFEVTATKWTKYNETKNIGRTFYVYVDS